MIFVKGFMFFFEVDAKHSYTTLKAKSKSQEEFAYSAFKLTPMATEGEEVMQDASEEEEDILHRSTKCNKHEAYKGIHPLSSSPGEEGMMGN